MNVRRNLNVLVVGTGEACAAVVNALGRLQGVGSVRQATETGPRGVQGFDVVVDMAGGVTPAYDLAMAALTHGTACITANPLLLMAHGRVLQAAAAGQQAYFGFQAAGFGLPMHDIVNAVPVRKMVAAWAGCANTALSRMAYRHETPAQVLAQLKLQQVDLSDMGGKVTQGRAVALRALWQPHWGSLREYARVGIDRVEPVDLKGLREFGLQLVFGAEIGADDIYTGPLAVGSESPLLAAAQHDVLLLETMDGSELVMSQPGDDTARIVAGVVADMRQVARSAKPLPLPAGSDATYARPDSVFCHVRAPYGCREALLKAAEEVVQERVTGDGQWQAVVQAASLNAVRAQADGGVVYPVLGDWEAPEAGLRLVG